MTLRNRKTVKRNSFCGLAIAVACTVGCQFTEPVIPIDDSAAVHDPTEQTTPKELWLALARAVKARSIESTERLAQIVVVLGRNGELSDQDLAKFDVAFPRITTTSRELSESDVQSLIQLGQVER